METRGLELTARRNKKVKIRVMEGHFATQHSHVSHCIDMTAVKSEMNMAKEAAKLFAENFYSTPIDTIITLERTKMIGAFLASELSGSGINQGADIAVVSPEVTGDMMILRDNLSPYVKNRRVLLLTATATTGLTLASALEGIRYYGGETAGAAAVFGGNFSFKNIPVVRLFGVEDIHGYSSFAASECPYCRAGIKIDALVNSYGYSKI